MNDTLFALIARFGDINIPLSDISEPYLGITPRTAEQQAKQEALPFPTFKVRGSEKSPTMVRAQDLASHIDSKLSEAKERWEEVNPQAIV